MLPSYLGHQQQGAYFEMNVRALDECYERVKCNLVTT